MSSVTFDESRIDADCHKRDNVNGHSQTQSRKSLVKKDSQFKITTPNCNVLQHLVRPAAMVAVPGALTEKEDTSETKDNVPHVAIVTAEKEEALWWHMDALKTSAPDICAKEAMFNMTIAPPDPKIGGSCVTFQSYFMEQYLIVVEDQDDHPDSDQPTQQPQFKFKLSSNPDEGVTSTFILGTAAPDDDPNYRFLRFQNPKDKQWYYWYVDGGEVGIRKEMESEIFNPVVIKDCN